MVYLLTDDMTFDAQISQLSKVTEKQRRFENLAGQLINHNLS